MVVLLYDTGSTGKGYRVKTTRWRRVKGGKKIISKKFRSATRLVSKVLEKNKKVGIPWYRKNTILHMRTERGPVRFS